MKRLHYLEEIHRQLRIQPVCGILGPRQVGKSTLAREYADTYYPGEAHFIDLEDPTDLERLVNPMLTLSAIQEKLIVIDEIQMRPGLFSILRVLVDRSNTQKFLILGSASRDLLQQSSETLAGRIGYIELCPFSLFEVSNSDQLWLRGGFPRSYLAGDNADSFAWRKNYITTFLERDIPALGFNVPPARLRRFWLMLAHYHGQIFNASEIGRSLGVSDHTAKNYLDILSGALMIRILNPWFENVKKRQIKRPKIYFRDSGILHSLIGIKNRNELYVHPRLGASWEGFALEEVIRVYSATVEECYFWGTASGAELDLLIVKDGKKIGFECKYTDHPRITKSMYTSLEDLDLDMVVLLYPGEKVFPLAENIWVYGLQTITTGQFMKGLKTGFME
ncbi:MAG: ATP-binding protein [Candidatus Babeliales bacterium]